MKLLIKPHQNDLEVDLASGINQVILAQFKYLPQFGVELVKPDEGFDLMMVHAAMTDRLERDKPLVAFCHGLYWTADYDAPPAEYLANQNVIQSIRWANEVVVPSAWVAEAFQRDMRFTPNIIGHGVDFDAWQDGVSLGEYTLWNKNRTADVCSPVPVSRLAATFLDKPFVTTFSAHGKTPNLRITGRIPHAEMMKLVKGCGLYLSTTKETFGIGTLEAMAAGKPVLGWAEGGNLELVQHGVNGYLAAPGNVEDLVQGYEWCLAHRERLGRNSREIARNYPWQTSIEKLAQVLHKALAPPGYGVSVVIPAYNKAKTLVRAVKSAFNQEEPPLEVIVVNDGSTDDTLTVAQGLKAVYPELKIIDQPNRGVAAARNAGIAAATSPYVCPLDADDWIKPDFLKVCLQRFKLDRTLGVVYTALEAHLPDGSSLVSKWPGRMDYDQQLQRHNQVPTCCLIKREAWQRVGGYRSRYCPTGAGSEDAAFWTALGAAGYGFGFVEEPLFCYSEGQGHTDQENYHEPDWLGWYPWVKDHKHPFASLATPESYSHPVYQYDQPQVSIVIPVGPGHETHVIEALDSLEAQSFKRWEAVVVYDHCQPLQRVLDAFPYVRTVVRQTGEPGAGAARNLGVSRARAKYILFLDADDILNPAQPDGLRMLYDQASRSRTGVYSDYIGRRFVDPTDLQSDERRDLIKLDDDGEAWFWGHAADFDCRRALEHPDRAREPYIWNLVSTLFPKAWHAEVGGFDELMPTWEDWDYWLRLVKVGKCFTRVREALFVYKFYSGTRRQVGIDNWDAMLDYMSTKHQGLEVSEMACNCGNRNGIVLTGDALMADMIPCRYNHPNTGAHQVVGAATKYKYDRHNGGGVEIFPVHPDDIAVSPEWFVPVKEEPVQEPAPELPPEPAILTLPEADIVDDLPITPMAKKALRGAGLTTGPALVEQGHHGLVKIKGIGEATAHKILGAVRYG